MFTVDLCRVKVLTHLSLLLAFICESGLGGVRGGSRDKNSHTCTLQLRNSLISCFLHERPGFGNTPFMRKLSVLLTTFSGTVTTDTKQGQLVLSVVSPASVVITPNHGILSLKVAQTGLLSGISN